MAQARTEFAAALNQIASEKGVDPQIVVDAIKAAALAAYKKDLMLRNEPIPEDFESFTSEVDPATGGISIFQGEKNVTPPGFARIAASIAKQVIMQRLNEAERGAILSEYENKVGAVISGNIQRQEGNTYFIDLGRAEGVFPPSEQVQSETYHQNLRMKFLVKEIREGGRGSEVVVSRSDPALVKALFTLEVPEIQNGSVEIKVIAREAGSRTKLAAVSSQEGVDPVGSLVGQKGVRVQAVMGDLGDEKIDIITYSDDPARFIAAALSPAKDLQVVLNDETKVATVTVPQNQMSLAIGKGGQNVRLAAKLTGWKIDIEGSGEPEVSEELGVKSDEAKTEEAKGTVEQKEQPQIGTKPADDKQNFPSDQDKEKVKEDIKEEVKEAEANAQTVEEKEAAEEAGEVLEKAVDEENIEQEKEALEEAIGEVSPAPEEIVSDEAPADEVTIDESNEEKSGEQESEKQE